MFQSAWRILEEKYLYEKTLRYVEREKRAGKSVLFVHTMGKVGSSTVRRSIRSSEVGESTTVYGTYFLSPAGVKFFRELEDAGYGRWGLFRRPVKSLMAEAKVLSEQLAAKRFGDSCIRVVSIVRDPVATNISGFFQNYPWWPLDLQKRCIAGKDGCVDELIAHFMQDYPHSVPVDWWDNELKQVFGVDVLASRFPKEEGYEIYKTAEVEVLVLKLEKMKGCFKQAIKEFMGIENIEIISKNEARDKWYGDVYDRFLETISLPVAYVDRLYNSPLYQNFYSQEELENFRSKWLR